MIKYRSYKFNVVPDYNNIFCCEKCCFFLQKANKHDLLTELYSCILQQDKEDHFNEKCSKEYLLKKQYKKYPFKYFIALSTKQFIIDDCRVKLPKIGWIKFHRTCKIIGKPKKVTISYSCGQWCVSIRVKQTFHK